MKRTVSKVLSKSRKSGAALIITLVMLAMLTVLIVGYLASMRTEMIASDAIYHAEETKMASQGAVAHAVSLLRDNIPDPAPISESVANAPGRLWMSNPGLLTIEGAPDVDLHTGAPSPTDDPNDVVDLNAPLPGELVPAIAWPTTSKGDPLAADPTTGAPVPLAADPFTGLPVEAYPPMKVKWQNVLRDPSQPAGPSVDNPDENPIVSRYAFWIDDESSRVNYNVSLGKGGKKPGGVLPIRDAASNANGHNQIGMNTRMLTPMIRYNDANGDPLSYTRRPDDPNTGARRYGARHFSLGSPRSISLETLLGEDGSTAPDHTLLGLTSLDAAQVSTDIFEHYFSLGAMRYPEGILPFLEDVGVPLSDARTWFNQNRFNLTHYSRSPEFNAFGKPRKLVLSTGISLEAGGGYQHAFFASNGVAGGVVPHMYGFWPQRGRSEWGQSVRDVTVEELYDYMGKVWPGETDSFVDKYGAEEAYQIALNFWSFGREGAGNTSLGSSTYATNMTEFTKSFDSTDSLKGDEYMPERSFWQIPNSGTHDLANTTSGLVETLPQMPGPYLTEICVTLEAKQTDEDPNGDGDLTNDFYLGVSWRAEVYMEPYGSTIVPVNYHGGASYSCPFTVRTDYIELDVLEENDILDSSTSNWICSGAARGATTRGGWKLNGLRGWWAQLVGPKAASGPDPFTLGPTEAGVLNSNFDIFETNLTNVMSKEHNIPTPWGGNGYNNKVNKAYFTVNAVPADPSIDIDVHLRLGLTSYWEFPKQVAPHPHGDPANPLEDGDPESVLTFPFKGFELSANNKMSFTFEVRDPLRAHIKEEWGSPVDTGQLGISLGAANKKWETLPEVNVYIDANGIERVDEYDSAPFADMRWYHGKGNPHSNRENVTRPGTAINPTNRDFHMNRNHVGGVNRKMPSNGYLTLIRNDLLTPGAANSGFQTMTMGETSSYSNSESPPDHLLLDIMGQSYRAQGFQWTMSEAFPSEYSTITYRHSTAGKINLNSRIYPKVPGEFQAPVRSRPLKAIFKDIRQDDDVNDLVSEIEDLQNAGPIKYIGEIGSLAAYSGVGYEHPDAKDTLWEEDEILRNLAGIMGVNSNTFGVWGVAQTVRKHPNNSGSQPGKFETNDVVKGEKRFYALVERYLWEGRDGFAGNAHLGVDGKWDRIARGVKTNANNGDNFFGLPGSAPIHSNLNSNRDNSTEYWPVMDGPSSVTIPSSVERGIGKIDYQASNLEEADNPADPLFKYRIVYFKYLDE